jgi:hypothetical protein
LQPFDRLLTFESHRGSQLLRQLIQFLSLVGLKLKKGLDLRFLDVHDLCNLPLFLLSEDVHVHVGELLVRIQALFDHGIDQLVKLLLYFQMVKLIIVTFEERAWLSPWRGKLRIAVELVVAVLEFRAEPAIISEAFRPAFLASCDEAA